MRDVPAWITQTRFDEYLVAGNHDRTASEELYEWNVSISAAFFELISHVEVALRNAVDRILQPLEVVESARVRPRDGWWFANPAFLSERDLDFYTSALRHLAGRAKTATRDKVLASMTFGLWVSVFGPSYEQLFRKHLVYAFPNRSPGFKREAVHRNVEALRNLRNRIAHHQAIFALPLEERYEQAMDILRWIDPDLADWVAGMCRVPRLLDGRPAAAESIAVVVPAQGAWPFYQEHHAYICQPGRYFRQVSHVGFYAEKSVQAEVPKVLERLERVRWTREEIGQRMRSGSTYDARIAEIIRTSRDAGWDRDEYQLFILTAPDNGGYSRGHVTLTAPLVNERVGKASAWVRRQRYVAVDKLQQAKTLAELDQL